MKSIVLVALTTVVVAAVGASSSPTYFASVDWTTPLTRPLPADFASVSSEVQCAPMFINGVNDSYVNLLKYLTTAGGGQRGPNIRIGGNSADWDYFAGRNDSGVVPPTTLDTILVNDTMIESYRRVADWHGTMIVDMSLTNQTNPRNAIEYLRSVFRIVADHSLIDGIEVGNEPDLFRFNGIRPGNYTYTEYQEDFSLYLLALKEANIFAFPRIQGAAACCFWDKELIGYVQTFANPPYRVLSSMSRHYYPMSGVSATFEKLLATPASQGVQVLAPLAAATVAQGIPFYVGEGNSAYTGGKEGVSNSFATALWAVDTMFYASVVNITRFNFHGCPGRTYTPITTDGEYPNHYARARPLYYGMLAFTEAIADSAMVVDVHTPNATTEANIKVWATVVDTPAGPLLRIVVLQKNLTTTEKVTMNITVGQTFAGKTGSLTRVHPESYLVNATTGISYGGISFDQSTDGRPIGKRVWENVVVDQAGVLSFTVDPASINIIAVAAIV